MFDLGVGERLGVQRVRAITRALADVGAGLDDRQRIEMLRALEELKCAAAGAQAAVTADLDASQRAAQAAVGEPRERQGRGVAAQVGLARRESHHRGARYLGLARVLRDEMPHTLAALRAGRLSEWRATILARETACLSLEDRREVDRVVTGDADRLEEMGDRELAHACGRLAYELDGQAVVERAARAESDRHVTIRPAPDTMVLLTALLPVAQGVAAFAALKKQADSARSRGDARGRGQLMADALVERITGRERAEQIPIEVGVVISDEALLGAAETPARVRGYGPIPAVIARELIARASAESIAALRRLYATPLTGQLVAASSRTTRFPEGLAELIRLRDEDTCRTLWCDAPIRPTDHARALLEDGPTALDNGQGLCEACNIAKEAFGWQARPRPGPRGHAVETTTPTGHTYTSFAPAVRPMSFRIRLPDFVFGAA